MVAYHYIEGYQPQAYNLTKTLSANEAENVFTFVYQPVPEDTVTTETEVVTRPGGTAGGTTAGTTEGNAPAQGTDEMKHRMLEEQLTKSRVQRKFQKKMFHKMS